MQHGGSDIKWVDGGKPLFKVSTFVVSTVNTQVSVSSWNIKISSNSESHKVDPRFTGGDSPFHKVSEEQVMKKEECLWQNFIPHPEEIDILTHKSSGAVKLPTKIPDMYLPLEDGLHPMTTLRS